MERIAKVLETGIVKTADVERAKVYSEHLGGKLRGGSTSKPDRTDFDLACIAFEWALDAIVETSGRMGEDSIAVRAAILSDPDWRQTLIEKLKQANATDLPQADEEPPEPGQ